MSVATVERAYVFSHPSRKGRFGCAFVVATPDGNTGMIAETFDFLHHVVVEDIQVVWQVRIGVDPEIIPHHDTEFVTAFVELFLRDRAEPVSYHVEVHFLIQLDPGADMFGIAA